MKLIIKGLIKFHFHLNLTALHIAIKKENVEIVRLLLLRNDIDVNEKTVL